MKLRLLAIPATATVTSGLPVSLQPTADLLYKTLRILAFLQTHVIQLVLSRAVFSLNKLRFRFPPTLGPQIPVIDTYAVDLFHKHVPYKHTYNISTKSLSSISLSLCNLAFL